MYNYSGNLSKQDFMEFESKYKKAFKEYDDSIIEDWMLIDFLNNELIDLNDKMNWLKKIGDKTAIEQLEVFLAEKNIGNDEIFVLQGVEADPYTDFWPKDFMGVFTAYDAAIKYIDKKQEFPMYYLIKYRANNDGTMREVCTFIWEKSRKCICYVGEYALWD